METDKLEAGLHCSLPAGGGLTLSISKGKQPFMFLLQVPTSVASVIFPASTRSDGIVNPST